MDRESPPNQPRKPGFSTNQWQHQGKYKGEHAKNGNARPTAKDWFEDPKSLLAPPKEKPAWNVWVAPKAQTPERRYSNPQPASNHNINGSIDSTTANGPQVHPDRLRLWSDEQAEFRNGSSKADPWLPTLVREDRDTDGQCNGTHEKYSMARNNGRASMSDEHSRSAEASHSHLPQFVTEPRHNDQARNNHRLSPASGKGTPGNTAMEGDEPSPSNPFGRRPSSRTGGAKAPTRPPPPHPDFNTEDPQASLLNTLGQFTSAVTSLASANVQRELAEKKVVRQKTELDRWRKHHSTFTSLAEEHEREMAKAKSASYLMDMRLKEHEAVRDEAIQAMATTMLANGNVVVRSDSGKDKKIRRMQNDITDIRSELNENLERLRSIQYEPSHVTGLARKQSDGFKEMKRALNDLENRAVTKQDLYDLDSHYITRGSFVEMEERFNKCTREWSKLQSSLTQDQPNKFTEQVDKLKEQMDSLYSLKLEVNKVEEKMTKLDGTLSTQGNTLQELNKFVLGENDDQGLLDYTGNLIGKVEQDVDKFRGTLMTFNGEIGTLSEDGRRQATRIEALELEMIKHDKVSASSADADLRPILRSVMSDVTALSEDLAQLKAEQETKDDLIGQETERIDGSLQAFQSQIASTRSDLEAAIGRIDVSLSEFQSRPVPAPPITTVPTPEVLPDVSARSDDPLTKDLAGTLHEHRRALKHHYDKLQAVEAFQISLSQRFDNLTTDRLAQNMVHQMQRMWPNAAEVKDEVDQVKEQAGQLTRELDGLKTLCEVLLRRVGTQDLSVTVKELKDQLAALALKCEILTDSTASSERAFQTSIQSLDSELECRAKELVEDAEKAKHFFALVSDQLRLDLESLSERVSLMENTNIVEIASLHGQVVELKNHCHSDGQANGNDVLHSTIVVDSDGTGRVPDDQSLPTPDNGSTTEPDAVAQPEKKMRRHKLLTQKEKPTTQKEKTMTQKEKRKRNSSSETEYDDRSKRRGEKA